MEAWDHRATPLEQVVPEAARVLQATTYAKRVFEHPRRCEASLLATAFWLSMETFSSIDMRLAAKATSSSEKAGVACPHSISVKADSDVRVRPRHPEDFDDKDRLL